MSKGSKPRNCFSQKFKNNYDEINWRHKPIIESGMYKWIERPSKECEICKSTDMDYKLSSRPYLCLKCMEKGKIGEGDWGNL